MAAAAVRDAWKSRSRMPSIRVTSGEGASSMTFWWRR
ncbi:Uncharacterised protein [Mycobacteroides abscessus subsp. abscessus]|nr:Uncharacterised protein [Mycobacteroides abscessus subsp. abscessus]